jgi:hypothetical protein
MSSDKWFSLDEKSKAIWDQLDDNSRSIILGYNSLDTSTKTPTAPNTSFSRPPFSKSPFVKPPLCKPPFKLQANLHEISAYDFILANMHEIDIQQEEQDDSPCEPVEQRIYSSLAASTSHNPCCVSLPMVITEFVLLSVCSPPFELYQS